MYGVTKPVEANGSIKVSGKIINASSEFSVNMDDYGINGGIIAAGKVSKEPTISVTAEF